MSSAYACGMPTGKHVVTANKALIASSMLEIEELLLAGGGACKFG